MNHHRKAYRADRAHWVASMPHVGARMPHVGALDPLLVPVPLQPNQIETPSLQTLARGLLGPDGGETPTSTYVIAAALGVGALLLLGRLA